MIKLLKRLNGERGQVLPLVLAFLAIGSLTIVPSLNYVTSNLNSSRSLNSAMKGTYAADAAIENTLWSLARSIAPPAQLNGVNNMSVSIQTENKGEFTLYFGELIQPGVHNDYLDVASSVVWDAGASAYKFTVTVTWQSGSGYSVIHLEAVGARLPPGYSYRAGSAGGFAANLSRYEPDIILDSVGAQMVNWEFGTPKPKVSEANPIATQTFYITGSGAPENYYSWVVANRSDVGEVGEFSGTIYRITAIARQVEDSRATARIVADALIDPLGEVYIIAWQTVNY